MYLFGDDPTEHVIQYLCFSDKVKFECLSKQWQRLVFNKEYGLDVDFICYLYYKNRKQSLERVVKENYEPIVNKELLESLLKKCPNISWVTLLKKPGLQKDDSFKLINQYC